MSSELELWRKLDSLVFWDGKSILANHSARLVVSNIQFESKSTLIKNFYEDIDRRIDLRQLLVRVAYWTSYVGGVIVKLNLNKQGQVELDLANPNGQMKVARIQQSIELIKLELTYIKDDRKYRVIEYWDDMKVVRKLYSFSNEISIDEFRKQTGIELKDVEYHNYGFIPLVVIENRPFNPDYYNNDNQKGVFDNIKDDYSVQYIPLAINTQYKTLIKETILGKSRAYGSWNPQELKKLGTNNPEEILLKELFVQVDMAGGTGAPQNKITLQQPSPILQQYTDAIKRLKEEYFEGSGYSTPEQSSQGETATSTIYSTRRDIETTNEKRKNLTNKLYELVDKALVLAGLANEINPKTREYVIEFDNNLFTSPKEQVELNTLKVEAMRMSRIEAIMNERGLDKPEAQKVLDEIMEEDTMLQQHRAKGLLLLEAQQGADKPEANKPNEAMEPKEPN